MNYAWLWLAIRHLLYSESVLYSFSGQLKARRGRGKAQTRGFDATKVHGIKLMLIAHRDISACRPTAPKHTPEMKDDNADHRPAGAGNRM